MLRFELDPVKDLANQRKHGVSFGEARSVFFDEEALEYHDPDHSEEEDRFLLLGRSYHLRVLVVCHCVREEGGRHPDHLGPEGEPRGAGGLLPPTVTTCERSTTSTR